MSEGVSAAACALCKGPMEAEGGAVLFTSSRGKPFEVCGLCRRRFEELQALRGQAEAEAALDAITQYANGIEGEDVFAAVAETAGIPGKVGVEDIQAEIERIREAKSRASLPAPKPGLLKRLAKPVRWLLLTAASLLMAAALFFMIFKWF